MAQEFRPTTPEKPNLLSYLHNYSPTPIPLQAETALRRPASTRSNEYGSHDIRPLPPLWASFNLKHILSSFHEELHAPLQAQLPEAWISPPAPIRNEVQLQDCANCSVYTHLRRALRVVVLRPGFSRMNDIHGEGIRNGSKADRIGVDDDKVLRLVGELKPSWNFHSSWREAKRGSIHEVVYRQALSQVNYYMHQNGVRHGYMLTDREFVAMRRAGSGYGDIEVATGVSWSHDPRECSVVLALFGLHMMAAKDDGWDCAKMEPPVPIDLDSANEEEDGSSSDTVGDVGSSWSEESSAT